MGKYGWDSFLLFLRVGQITGGTHHVDNYGWDGFMWIRVGKRYIKYGWEYVIKNFVYFDEYFLYIMLK